MNQNLEKFINENKPKYKLKKFENEIIYLIKEGYTQTQILQYLREYYSLIVSRQTLSNHLKFLHRIELKKVKNEAMNKHENASKTNSFPSLEKISQEEFLRRLERK